MDSFELELRSTFLEEAKEIAIEVERLLRKLESKVHSQQDSESLARYFHNLKGSARAVGLDFIAEISHQLESALESWKLSSKESPKELVRLWNELLRELKPTKPKKNLRVSIQRLNELVDGLEDIFTNLDQKPLSQTKQRLQLARQQALAMRMVPVARLFQKMENVVREVSDSLNKKIGLKLHGQETELDKALLEEIQDPLMHLVQNAMDHGIVSQGNVTLKAYHQNNRFVIECHDDGRGIDPKKIQAVAKERGWASGNQVLSDKEWYQFLFLPGFSTKQSVSTVSGRGVGLDVVKQTVSRLGGSLEVESSLGKGTVFRISLPLVIAMVEGWVVEAGGEFYVFPLSQVERVGWAENGTLRLEGLLKKKREKETERRPAVRNTRGTFSESLSVDNLVGPQVLVSHAFGRELKGLKGVSGGALLSNGKLALILDLPSLLENVAGASR